MTEPTQTTSPGAFIQASLGNFAAQPVPMRSVTPHDRALFDAVNQFACACGEAPMAIPTQVPEAFTSHVREFFYWVNAKENPYTTIYEAKQPALQDIEHAYESLTLAVDSYLNNTDTSIMSGTHAFPLDDIPSDNERPRIWRRRVEILPSGEQKSVFEEVDHIDFTKKAVIGFGGVTQFHGNPRIVNGFLKQMESAMGGPDIYAHNVALYTISYPVAHRTRYHADTYRYNSAPNSHVSVPARQFTDTHIMPWLVKDGEKNPSIKTLRERFAALNFFGYSYGTVFVKEVSNAVSERLQAMGYSTQDVAQVISNGYALNVGQTARIDVRKPAGDFSSVYVVAPGDMAARSKSNLQPYLKHQGEMLPIRDNEMLIKSHAPQQGVFLTPGGGLPDGFRQAPLPTVDIPGHNIKAYTQPMLTYAVHNPSYIGSFMRYALLGKQGALKTTDTPARHQALEAFSGNGARTTLPGRFVYSALKSVAERESRGEFLPAF